MHWHRRSDTAQPDAQLNLQQLVVEGPGPLLFTVHGLERVLGYTFDVATRPGLSAARAAATCLQIRLTGVRVRGVVSVTSRTVQNMLLAPLPWWAIPCNS